MTLALGCAGSVTTSPDDPPADDDTQGSPAPKPGSKPGGAGGTTTSMPPGTAASPGGSNPVPSSAFACKPGEGTVAGRRLWRLTAAQLNNTAADLLGDTSRPARGEFFRGSGQEGYLNNAFDLRVRDNEAVQLRLIVKGLAAETVADAGRLSKVFATTGCDGKLADAACIKQFVSAFGKRAFRRPLATSEVDDYVALYNLGKQKGEKVGVQVVIEAMLQSPKFLYRFELGADGDASPRVRLTPHELATALSYHLTGTMPDDELMAAADGDRLQTPAQLEQQAMRLLTARRDKAGPALFEFFRQFLEYEELETRDKDPALFPEYASVRHDMLEELRLFVDDVLWKGGGKLTTLLSADYTFANAAIGKLYGQSVAGSGWQRIATNREQRAGVLTQPGLMAHLAVLERTSPVNRGRFVQERLFCTKIPDPPGDVDVTVPDLAPGLTRRQQLEMRTSSGSCGSCHGLINGIGFGLEGLDAIGRFRTTENELPVDSSGEIKGTKDSDGAFKGPRGLADKLAASQQVKECFARQSFRYAAGRAEGDGDACSLKTIHDRFAASGYDLTQLAVGYVLSESFAYRTR